VVRVRVRFDLSGFVAIADSTKHRTQKFGINFDWAR
jgi:hypothetical protein